MQAKRFISMLLLLSIVFPAFSIQRLSAAVPEFGSVRVEVENNGTQDAYVPMAPTRLGNKLLVYWQDMAAGYQEHYTVINPDGSLDSLPPVTLSPRTNDLSDTVLYGALSNGNMVVYWYSGGSGKGFTDTYFKIIDENGTEIVGATKINSSPGELNRFTKFAELSNGNLAFVWATSGGEYALRRFQPDGTAVDGAQLSVTALAGISSSQYSHDIAANGNGKFMIMISYYHPNYVGMIFDNDASAPNQVNGQNSFVISSRGENGNEIQWLKVLPDGRFLTVYQKITGADSSTRSVAFRIYNEDGTPAADETVIRPLNSWGTISEPIILPDGGFALSYSYVDYNTEPDTYQTYFESYSSTGAFQNDLSASMPAVNDQYGAVFPFQDVDGKISFLVNDKESGDPTYDSWLLRHGESTHTVTFQDWDGTGLKTETVNHGAAATAPANPSRTGYTFTGWSAAFANVTADLTVTAQYDANEYTVSFESNGGSAVAAVQADFGTKLTAPAAPTRDGYSFDGWYKDAGLTAAWDFGTDTVPVDGMTLYAKWTIKTYTVTFQDWDGTGLKTETVNHGAAATAPANPSRTGYTFTGWSAAFANVTADLTVTAQYDANEYTVSFESNGGSAVAAVQADYGTKLTAPAAPTRDGYSFDGWYKDAGLTAAWDFGTDTVPVDGMTLYAKWTIKTYTVTFQDWDGTGLKTETVNHGTAATAPANPTRTGYTFTGWSAAFASVTADLTVTAQYDANEYTVSFESNGGSAVGAVQADYGTKLTAPDAPTRDGFDFDGWYRDAGLTTAWDFGTDTVPVDGLTLYAKWTIKTYTVTFQDWDGAGLKTETVNHGAAATAPANPARTGYTFTGWSAAFASVTADLTVTAQYDANEYTVSFESNGGSAVAAVQADFGTKLTAPDAPTRDGFDFDGWYRDAGLTAAWDFGTDTVPVDGMTLYAKWTIKTYTVTFQDWDGTGLKTETVNHGTAATAPANPTRTGYTFTGWSAAIANVTADLTVTAQYDANEYTVSFESNGGSAVAAVQADFGTKLTAPAAPTRDGYSFDGWYKDAGLTATWDFGTDTVPVDGMTLYAKWTIKTYTVTFQDWDGTGLKTETVNHGAAATAPANPSRTGYTFTGWSAAFASVIADLTVTAQYSVNAYTVSFESNGGSAVAAVQADYGTKLTAPAAPTRDGFSFGGWYADAGLTTVWNFSTDTVPANNMTLYAKWTIKTYTVTFQDWDGTGLKTETVNHGAAATAPANPSRTGYTFTGWSAAFASVIADLTVTAQYSVNAYTVSFESNGGSAVAAVQGDYGTKLTAPAAPTRDGYRFDGWYKDAGLTTRWTFSTDTMPANAITLYSKWTAVYKVTYNGNGHTSGSVPTDGAAYEHAATAAVLGNAGSLARSGYTFGGWNTKADGSGTSYAAADTFTIDHANVTLYARWNQIPVALPATPSPAPSPAAGTTGVDVLVNGKVENAGNATTNQVNGQTVTVISVDQKKLEDKLAAEGLQSVVTIPSNTKSDVVVGELNGRMVKNMESKQAVLEIRTDRATYTLPAEQINIDSVSGQFGRSVELQDIKVRIEIAAPPAETAKLVENAAEKGSFSLVMPAIEFTVRAANGGETIEVTKFNAYVERTIAIPDGVDPSKITTGVVVEPDGTVRHVPTKVVVIDGKYYARINSLTNSTYSVVWHPLEFEDMKLHWAKEAVNDTGSRMIIEGDGNGSFHPDREITRAEFAAIVVRALGLRLESGDGSFPDVQESDWYNGAINTAYAYQLITGFEDGTFRPNDKITREQATTIIAKAMTITKLRAKLGSGTADSLMSSFHDAMDVSGWARNGLLDTLQAGIVTGRNGSELAPKALISRAEVAVMVQRLLKKSELI